MARSADNASEAKIAELKRLIRTGSYETQEMLEDAVDRLLWSEHDRLQEQPVPAVRPLVHAHPK